MDFTIPHGLFDLLKNVTIAVLRERPLDLYDFVADYFVKVRDQRRKAAAAITDSAPSSNHTGALNPSGPGGGDGAPHPVIPLYIIVDDDDLASEPDPASFRPKTRKQSRTGRRSSVSAERYDPEAEALSGAADEKVVHPKTDEQTQRLKEAVRDILLFRSLESALMTEVINAMFERKVQPEEHVIRQGDDGDNFYVIESGVYDVIITRKGEEEDYTAGGGGQRVHQFDGKGSFGELALMYNMPRAATVVAVTEGTLWAMDRQSFRRIVLLSAFKKRKLYEALLERVPMLQSLDAYERMSLADALLSRSYNAGECIIREGDEDADGMYFIEEGQVRVTITTDGRETEVKRISAGMYFGEMALLERSPRTASVYAADPPSGEREGGGGGSGVVKVAFLERESFERLLGPCLDVMKRNVQSYKLST